MESSAVNRRCELLGWSEVERAVRQLAGSIAAADFHPDLIVAIARGGFVPARLLCDQLDVHDLVSIRIEHYAMGVQRGAEARLRIPLAVDIAGKNVLLVDDVSDTGDTLRLASEHLRAANPAQLRVAVLHHKTGAHTQPDFFGAEVARSHWLSYPWARVEDLRSFIGQLAPQPASLAQARAALHAQWGVHAPRAALAAAWRRLKSERRAR